MVDSHGLFMRVRGGDQCGHAVEDGHGVQSLGQQPEPLFGHRVFAEEALRAVFDPTSDVDALFRWEVPAAGGEAPRAFSRWATESARPR